jgi:ribosomal protein L37AE/L43A
MEYKLYDGKNLVSINGEEGLKATLEMLQNKKEVRRGLIHRQKVFTSIGGGMDEMLKEGHLVREGTREEFEKEDNDTMAVKNFARLLKKNFPEDWKATVVTMYQGALPLPQDLRCPDCHTKLQERKKVDGYTCRNGKCKNIYQAKTSYSALSSGVVFRPENEISTIVLEPKL